MMYNKWYGTRKERTSSPCLLNSETERGGDVRARARAMCEDSRGHLYESHNQVLRIDTRYCALPSVATAERLHFHLCLFHFKFV